MRSRGNRAAMLACKLASCVCGAALAAGLVPAVAFASDGLQAAAVPNGTRAQQAARIDEMADCFDDGSIIVVYREGAEPSKKAQAGARTLSVQLDGMRARPAQVLTADAGTPGGGAALHVNLPTGVSVGEAVASAQEDPDVVLAQPNFVYYLSDDSMLGADANDGAKATSAAAQAGLRPLAYSGEYPLPNDPLVGEDGNDTSASPSSPNQWWIHAVNAPQAWSLAHGEDNPVAVAVLDTGIDFDHEDLKNNLLADYAYDAYHDERLTESIDNDEMQHGCHVAGIIAAEADNGVGIAGVSYNAKVLPIRVFHLEYSSIYGYERATCSDEDLIRAYDYLLSDADGNGMTVAQETNTRVVNMSLGGYLNDSIEAGEDPEEAYDYLFEDKIEQAEEAGILTVAAAGNGDEAGNGRADASYPSDYPAVMSVVALKTADMRTQWSDHNAMKNIAAPGNNIYSTYWTGEPPYRFESGTSMATPLVAGCAALLWAYDPSLSVRDVKDVLYGTADDLGSEGFDEYYGWGRVNIGAAVKSLGTATVSLERSTMMRTTKQQLKASEIADRSAKHTWRWCVDDPSVARVSESGELTAVAAGKVVVTARAEDDDSLEGHRTVEVTEIALPGAVIASANPQKNTITLSWEGIEAATRYRVLRATNAEGSTSEPGPFTALGVFDAAALSASEGLSYADTTARPSDLYWYQVVPVGELDGELVDGAGAVSNRCFYTDKAALKTAIDEAEGLLDATLQSADGTDVPEGVFWCPASARDELNLALLDAYSAYMSGSMLQVRVDYYTEKLTQATEVFKGARKPGAKQEKASQMPETGGQGDKPSDTKPTDPTTPEKPEETTKPAEPGKPALKANGLVAQGKKAAVTYSAAKASKIAVSKLVSTGKATGALSYRKASGSAGITVARNGTVTVRKGTPAGTYSLKIVVSAAGSASVASATKTVACTVRVAKAVNPLKAKGKAPQVKYGKKKARAIAAQKAYRVTGAKGKVSYRKLSGSKKVSVNEKTGKITVKKGCKPGTYKVKVKIRAKGGANYRAGSKTVTVKVKVRK